MKFKHIIRRILDKIICTKYFLDFVSLKNFVFPGVIKNNNEIKNSKGVEKIPDSRFKF